MTIKKTLAALRQRISGLPRSLGELNVSLQLLGSMREVGWQKSYRAMPIDGNGKPVPWLCYSAIRWLEGRIKPTDDVLEWGSGGSSLFFAARASSVTSIEHNEEWYNAVKSRFPENCKVFLRTAQQESNGSDYVNIGGDGEKTFDIIVVDGIERNACMREAAKMVAPNGLIILDNSEREEYKVSEKLFSDEGFRRIDFTGISPGSGQFQRTTMFFRTPDRWISFG